MKPLNFEHIDRANLIKNYWLKEKKVVFFIFFFGIAFNVLTVLGPVLQGKLIDTILNGESTNQVIIMSLLFVGAIISIQFLRFFKRFYVRRFANNTVVTMRLMIYNNIMNRDAKELDSEKIGNIMTRVISDVDICVEGMRKVTTEVFDTGVLMLSYFVSMLFYDVKITLLSCSFIPIAVILAEVLKSVIYKYSTEYRTKSSQVADLTYSNIENTILFRINGLEEKNRNKYFTNLTDLQNKAVKANVLENTMQPIYNIIALLGIVVVIYLGGSNVINRTWTVGVFSTYIVMFTATTTKASKAAKLFNTAQKSKISWLRIKPYMSQYVSKDEHLSPLQNDTHVVVKDLSFAYDKENKIIENINFECQKGEIIGITGPIASGKSTLGLSLLGLYPYGGSIKINGKELEEFSQSQKSDMISYLGHDAELISDTIYNNITLGKNKSIDDVIKDVCFDKDLESMKDKENTITGSSGVRLSGGQKARLGLARALLNKNKIIILDDPFSAVDMNTEKQIIENLRKNYRDSIIIIISHRLAIFKGVDRIILLDNEKMSACGNHDDLMAKSKLYSTIYNLQSGEENEK